jgi:hypothetical protein
MLANAPNIRKLKKISLTPGQEPITNRELGHFQKGKEMSCWEVGGWGWLCFGSVS